MAKSLSPAAGIYVPVLNEKTIKRINHWDLGLVNNDWHLHRNYNQHIHEILHFFQDYAGGKYRYFNVLRFYLEGGQLGNNEDINSLCLGLVIHAWQQITKKKLKYQAVCASGDLYKTDEGGLRLKAVENLPAKFKQFISFAGNREWRKDHRLCFACVSGKGQKEKLRKQLQDRLAGELGEELAGRIDLIVLENGGELNSLWEVLIADRKKIRKKTVLIACITTIVILGAAAILFFNYSRLFPVLLSEVIYDDMQGNDWYICSQHEQSRISIESIPGREDKALQINFFLPRDTWAVVEKKIDPQTLRGSKGFVLYFRWEGVPNSLEFKLLDKEHTTFGYIKHQMPETSDWDCLEILLEKIKFWWLGGGCEVCSKKLSLKRIYFMQIAVSNKPGYEDYPGMGKVIIDDIYLLMEK